MEALDCLEKRASVRKYEKKTMSEEDIKTILKAGMEAPSAMNLRPYEFIVNTKNDFWGDFAKEKPTCEIMREASLTILILGDTSKNSVTEFLVEDCSAVAENMLLAAEALGYGSLWAGVRFHSDFQKKLSTYFALPHQLLPIAVLVFGKGTASRPLRNRYEEAKIHYEKY